jgi:hypothetical protein
MQRAGSLSVAIAAAFAVTLCAALHGQTVEHIPADLNAPQGKAIAEPVRLKPYFSDTKETTRPHSVQFLAVDQMTEADRLQAANAESSIAEHTRYTGLEFNQGAWAYQQVVCPALPNHIFLRFLRNNGTGDVSMFTASIPRGSEGRVRIIPIQLRGYSLFSPAPINKMTISAFNHIRAEEDPDKDPDWLGTALCYAALAGGHPQAATLDEHPENDHFPVASEALLSVGNGGGAELSFTDVNAKPRPMRWSMTFDKKGMLVKGGHAPADLLTINMTHPLPVDKIGPPMRMTQPTVKTSNPPAPAVVTQNPPGPPTVVRIPAATPPS